MALGILLSFYLDFILVLPYFRFRSVLLNLQASSEKKSELVRATQRQQNWRYIAATAKFIGAAWYLALIGKVGRIRSTNTKFSRIFFMFAALRLLAEYESQRQQYWRSIRTTKEQAKRGKLFAALRLLLQKSPNIFSVLTGNGNMFNTRRRRKNAQRHSPRPIRNDWRYFRPTLVFAGHYL